MEYICSKCAKIYPTCCKINNKQDLLFPLTKKEIDILKKKYPRDDFFCKEKITAGFLINLKKIFPEEKKIFYFFREKNFYFRLSLIDNRCFFLKEDGCELETNIRPFFCRIYPFWIVNNKISIFKDKQCLAQKNNDIKELLKIFNYQIEQIFYLFNEYKKNLLINMWENYEEN